VISRDEFWHVIEVYSAGIRPAQIVFYLSAILIVGWLYIKPGRLQSLFTKLYLSIAFAWLGIVFEFTLAKGMSGGTYGNYFVGSIFIVISGLFLVDIFRQKMQFSPAAVEWQRNITLGLLLLVFSYPLLGIAFGHRFSHLIMPGTYPCPTTALGLLLVSTAFPQVNKTIYILLLICAIPFTPLYIARYGVYEDAILFTTGIYGLVLLLLHWKVKKQPFQSV
jgi:hypothetical protein